MLLLKLQQQALLVLKPSWQALSTQTPATGTAATRTPVMGDAAEPENQPMPLSFAPMHVKKWIQKAGCLLQEVKAGASWE